VKPEKMYMFSAGFSLNAENEKPFHPAFPCSAYENGTENLNRRSAILYYNSKGSPSYTPYQKGFLK